MALDLWILMEGMDDQPSYPVFPLISYPSFLKICVAGRCYDNLMVGEMVSDRCPWWCRKKTAVSISTAYELCQTRMKSIRITLNGVRGRSNPWKTLGDFSDGKKNKATKEEITGNEISWDNKPRWRYYTNVSYSYPSNVGRDGKKMSNL